MGRPRLIALPDCQDVEFRPQPHRGRMREIFVQPAEGPQFTGETLVPSKAVHIAVGTDERTNAPSTASPARAASVVMVDVQGLAFWREPAADSTFSLLSEQEQIDELARDVVVGQTYPLGVAGLAVRPGHARRIEDRVLRHRLVLAASEAFDNAPGSHGLHRSVVSLLPNGRQVSSLASLLRVTGTEPSGGHRSRASVELAQPNAAPTRTATAVDGRQSLRPAELHVMGLAQPLRQWVLIVGPIAGPPVPIGLARSHSAPSSTRPEPTTGHIIRSTSQQNERHTGRTVGSAGGASVPN